MISEASLRTVVICLSSPWTRIVTCFSAAALASEAAASSATGWIGNLKEVKYNKLMAERPEFAMELAVKGMLPKNVIGRTALTRLHLYKGEEHKHAAQKPEAWTLD